MRVPWRRSNTQQLDLLGDATLVNDEQSAPRAQALPASRPIEGRPASVPVSLIDEDPANPRAESSDAELEELAADIGLRGILVLLVVHPPMQTGGTCCTSAPGGCALRHWLACTLCRWSCVMRLPTAMRSWPKT